MHCTARRRKTLIASVLVAGVYWVALQQDPNPVDQVDPHCQTDFRTKDVDSMQPLDMFKYLYWTNSSSCRIAHDFGGETVKFYYDIEEVDTGVKPIGNIDGQKTMCMDLGLAPKSKNCLVYSFGINNQWSFDDAMESYGCQIYAFDPSMSQEDHDHTPNIHFFKLGIGSEDVEHDPVTGWKLRTLESIYKMLILRHGNVPIDYLKMDVEDAEWEVIPQIIRSGMMTRVKQLAVEIHFNSENSLDVVKRKLNVLKMIEDQSGGAMTRFGSRANRVNNGLLLNHNVFNCLELAWYNSLYRKWINPISCVDFKLSDKSLIDLVC